MREIVYNVVFNGIGEAPQKFTTLIDLAQQLKAALAEIESDPISLGNFEKELSAASKGLVDLNTGLASIKSAIDQLNASVIQTAGLINKAFEGQDDLTKLRNELQQTQKELAEVQEKLKQLPGSSNKATEAFLQLEAALEATRKAAGSGELVDVDVIQNLRKQIQILSNTLVALGDADPEKAKELSATINKLKDDLARAQSVARNGIFAEGSLEDLNLKLEATERRLKQVSAAADPSEFQRLSKQAQELRDQIDQVKAASNPDVIKELRKQIKSLNNEILSIGDADPKRVSELSLRVEGLRRKLEQAQQVAKRGIFDSNSLQEARLRLRNLTRELDNIDKGSARFALLTEEVERLSNQIRIAEKQSGRFQRNIGNYPTLLKGLTQGFRRIGAAVVTAFSVQEVIFRTRDAIAEVLRLTVAFSGEITRATSLAQQTSGELETVGQSLNLNLGEGISELGTFLAQLDLAGSKARQFAAVSNFTAEEVSESFTQLGRSGFSLNQIFEVSPEAQTFALAAGEDLAKSTDVLISALRTFNTEAELNANAQGLAEDATNTFVGALTSANLDLEQFNEAFKQIAPTANQFDIDLASVSNTIAELANRNLRGTIATTSLRTAFVRLVSGIPAVTEEINRLNLNLTDSEGQLLPIPQLIGELNRGLKDLAPDAQQAALAVLVGNRAINQFNTLLEIGQDNLERGEARLRGYTVEVGVLRAELEELAQGADRVALDRLEDLNIDLDLNLDGSVNVEKLLADIDAVFDELSATEQLDLVTTIFGEADAELIVAELNKGSDAADGLGEALQRAASSGRSLSAEIAAIQLGSLENQTKLFDSALQELSLTIGDEISPAFESLLTDARLFVTAFSEAIKGTTSVQVLPAFQEAVERGIFSEDDLASIDNLIVSLNSLGEGFSTFADILKVAGPPLLLYLSGLRQVRLEALVAEKGFDQLTETQRKQLNISKRLNRIFSLSVAPLRLLGAASREVRLAFSLAQTSATGFRGALQRTQQAAVLLGTSLGTRLQGGLKVARNGFKTFSKVLLANPLFAIVAGVNFLVQSLKNLASKQDETGKSAQKYLDVLGGVAQFLTTVFVDAIGGAVTTINFLFNAFTGNTEKAKEQLVSLKDTFSNSVDSFNDISTAPLRGEIDRAVEAINSLSEEITVDSLTERIKENLNEGDLSDVDTETLKEEVQRISNEILGAAGEGDFAGSLFADFQKQQLLALESNDALFEQEIQKLRESQRGLGELSDQYQEIQAQIEELSTDQFKFSQSIFRSYEGQRSKVEATLVLLGQQLGLQKDINETIGDGAGLNLDSGQARDAIRDLALQADRILQRLETVGDRANERLEQQFVQDLVRREEFQALSLERQVALLQDGLNRINEARRKARQQDLDEERVYLERQLALFSRSVQERELLRRAEFELAEADLRLSLERQEITQRQFNDRFAQEEFRFNQDLSSIRNDSFVDRLQILVGDNSEILDRLPELRSRLEQERALRAQQAQAQLADFSRQREAFRDQLATSLAERERLEQNFTTTILALEQQRTDALNEFAREVEVGDQAQAIIGSFDSRIEALEAGYTRESSIVTDRIATINQDISKLNAQRLEIEAEQERSLQELLQQRTEQFRLLREQGADFEQINQLGAQFDKRQDILNEGFARQIDVVSTQSDRLTAALERAEQQQIGVLSRFNERRLALQQNLNKSLTTLVSGGTIDTSALVETFVQRQTVIEDSFINESEQLETQATATIVQLGRLAQSRVAAEQSFNERLDALKLEREAALSDVDVSTSEFDQIVSAFQAREALLRAAFAADVSRIDAASQEASEALQNAYNKRLDIDRNFLTDVVAAQQKFVEQLNGLQAKAELDFSINTEGVDTLNTFFNSRADSIRSLFDAERSLIAEQSSLVNKELRIASELRSRSDSDLKAQVESLESFQEEIKTLASGADIQIDGPGVTDIPTPLDPAILSQLESLAQRRKAILEEATVTESDILARREQELLDSGLALEAELAAAQGRVTNFIAQINAAQQSAISNIDFSIDTSAIEDFFEQREQTILSSFTEEQSVIAERILVVRGQLAELTEAQLDLNRQLRADLLEVDAEFQRNFAEAISQGATQDQLSSLIANNKEEVAAIREVYSQRNSLLVGQEKDYQDLLRNLSERRAASENAFFSDSAINFQRGLQLLSQSIATGGETEVDITLDLTFGDAIGQIRGQLTAINNEIAQAQLERIRQDVRFGDRSIAELDNLILELEARRNSLASEQTALLAAFNSDLEAFQQKTISTIAQNLEGSELFSALSSSLDAQVVALNAKYDAANEDLQTRLDERLDIQRRIDQEAQQAARDRQVNLENQLKIAQAVAEQSIKEIPRITPSNFIEQSIELALKQGELIAAEQDIRSRNEDREQEINQRSNQNLAEIKSIQDQLLSQYSTFQTDLSQILSNRQAVFDNLVSEGVLPERVAQIQGEVDALIVAQNELLELERQQNEARISNNKEAVEDLESQIISLRTQLNQSAGEINAQILNETLQDYEDIIDLVTELNLKSIQAVNELRDTALEDAESTFKGTLERISSDLLAEDVFTSLLENAGVEGGKVLDDIDLGEFNLTKDQINALSAALDTYRESSIAANTAAEKGLQDVTKEGSKLIDTFVELRQKAIDFERETAELELEIAFDADISDIRNQALLALSQNASDAAQIEDERRARELIREQQFEAEKLQIKRVALASSLLFTNQSAEATSKINQELLRIESQLGTGSTDLFEDISKIANQLTNSELRLLREQLKGVIEDIDDPELRKKLEEALEGNSSNFVKTTENIAEQTAVVAQAVSQLADVIGDAFKVDERLKESQAAIDSIIKKQSELDTEYGQQIRTLERLIGIEKEGLAVTDSRNLQQRLAATGLQESLEQELSAIQVRYSTEKALLDRRLREEEERNRKAAELAQTLALVQTAASLATAATSAVAAVAKFTETTSITGPLALALIPAFVATLAAAVSTAKNLFSAELGGQVQTFGIAEKGGQPVELFASGGLRSSTQRKRRFRKIPNNRRPVRVPRGKVLRGRSHANGGILTELEGKEFVSSVPTVEMFLPQLNWMNEQGNAARDGKPFSKTFPANLFPSEGSQVGIARPKTTIQSAPKIPTRVIKDGWARDGGLVQNLSEGFNSIRPATVSDLQELKDVLLDISENIQVLRFTLPQQKSVLVVEDLNRAQSISVEQQRREFE